MRQVKAKLDKLLTVSGGDVIIDAPPGVSCPAVTAVLDSDVIILVTEPTPFGFYDFRLAWESFSPLGKPLGVVVNRAGLGTDEVYRFCRDKDMPILAEIPYDRAIAEAYARGQVVAELSSELQKIFLLLRDKIRELTKKVDLRRAAHA
jgi:MinD superfamily P-loop ATPase